MSTENAQTTKLVTGLVRLSYANLFVPTSVEEGGDKKYSVSILIPKTDKETIKKIEAAIEAAKEAGKPKWGGKIPVKGFKLPLRDGDEDRPDDDAYAGHFFINASSKTKPGVVDKDLQPVLDQDEVYSGCFGRVSINFYPFDAKGNKGIAAGLNNVQKIKDGEALAGKSRAEDDFAEALEVGDLM
ncbi:MAG: DUF2815 family protein [Chitinophagia bacterium]